MEPNTTDKYLWTDPNNSSISTPTGVGNAAVNPNYVAPTVSEGTESLVDANTLANQDATNAITNAEGTNLPTDTVISNLTDQLKNIGTMTADDLAAIEEAGNVAGAVYDPYIEQSQEDRRVTMPNEIVRAGEKGGFMNTQFAGIAATQATGKSPGEAFLGTTADDKRGGGILDQKRQTLDRAVALLQAKKQEAIAAAKMAQRQAIMTGKRSDYSNAIELAKLAEQFQNNAEQLAMDKQKLALSYAQEDRLQISSDFDIISNLGAGQTIVLGDKEYTGISIEEVDAFWTSSAIVSLAKTIPVGESQTVEDPKYGTITITGRMTNDPNTTAIQSTDDAGNVTITTYDKSGKIVAQADAGKIGKTKTQASNVTLNLTQGQSDALSAASQRLDENKGGGYIDESGNKVGNTFWNTGVYIDERNKYASTPGADVKDFDLQYGWNLDPADSDASRILNSIGQAPKAKSLTEQLGEVAGSINFDD